MWGSPPSSPRRRICPWDPPGTPGDNAGLFWSLWDSLGHSIQGALTVEKTLNNRTLEKSIKTGRSSASGVEMGRVTSCEFKSGSKSKQSLRHRKHVFLPRYNF